MNCPVCKNTTLVMATRNDVEIDYCPTCRGVWLDRGELDKIIERTHQLTSPPTHRPEAPKPAYDDDRKHYGQGHYDDRSKHHPHQKKKSYWSDLFDFD